MWLGRSPRVAARLSLVLIAFSLWVPASASGHDVNVVWPVAYAESRLELDYRWVDKAALTEARYELGQARLIGDPAQISDAIRRVERLQQGLSVDLARCLGVGKGWVGEGIRYHRHIRCRLEMSDNDLNFATVRGVLHVLGRTRFKFVVTSSA